METKFKFNSQVCTSIDQSRRLLALGLKRETADMTWHFSYMLKGEPQYDCLPESTWDDETIQRYVEHGIKMALFDHWKHDDGSQMTPYEIYDEITKKDIPAWSLHRLIEMLNRQMQTDGKYVFLAETGFDTHANIYDNIIDCIEWLIQGGYFNMEYLV